MLTDTVLTLAGNNPHFRLAARALARTTISAAVLFAIVSVVLFAGVTQAQTPTPAGADTVTGPLAVAPLAPLRAALIIGNNRSPRGALPDLLYADDDALRTRETLRAVMPDLEVALLTRADDDTVRLFGDDARAATNPTRAAVDDAVSALAARFAEARAQGATSELYLVFSGHGDRDQAGGYLELEDGALRRADLLTMIATMKPSRAHVVLDACNSFFVVNARRPGGRAFVMRHEVEAGLSVEGVEVGVLLSTSADAEVYEWSQLSGGIFSHVLRSGLSGAADANGDGVLAYAELQGFMDVAVQDLQNAEYRPRLFMSAPADGRFLRLPNAPVLRGAPGHITVRDARGVRVLDVHSEPGYTPRLVAVGDGPFTATHVGADGSRVTGDLIVNDDGRTLAIAPVALNAMAGRGPPLVFDNLFAAAFGPTALQAATRARELGPEPVYGLSTSQRERVALQLRVAAQQARKDRTAGAATAITLGSVAVFTGVGGTAAGLLDVTRGVEETLNIPLLGAAVAVAVAGAATAVWGGTQLLWVTDIESAMDTLAASGTTPSEPALLDAIGAVRVAARREETALLDDRESLGSLGLLSLAVGGGAVALAAAPLFLGGDEPVDPLLMALGGVNMGLGVGALAMAGYHAATQSPDEKLTNMALLVQLIDEDPDGPTRPRALLPSSPGTAPAGTTP
jgi:hypothetical protein